MGCDSQIVLTVSTFTKDIMRPHEHVAPQPVLDVALLTGGVDRPYAYGLTMALAAKDVRVQVIGNDVVDSVEMHSTPNVRFFNLWPAKSSKATSLTKALRILRHYRSLIGYAAVARPQVFHILWNSKIQIFDRTLLMLYFKMLGKKISLTAHNVNEAKRDSRDSWLNRVTLRIQYHLTNQIFVHTQRMKNELISDFGVADQSVTVIRHPINDAFPDSELTPSDAKRQLGLSEYNKTILCFGRIKPYKGIELLLTAFRSLATRDEQYRLVIAGEVQKGNEVYWASLVESMASEIQRGQVIPKTQFIPDEEIEIYFKAADVMVLPYKDIFQSGVLFLGYSFGLPVIVTDVGSFREEIVEGKTGYLCIPDDAADLSEKMRVYFASDIYLNLGEKRREIKDHARICHSWRAVADLTRTAYERMLWGAR
jgi:D-inositol-3-phosphate glycosyltransferase